MPVLQITPDEMFQLVVESKFKLFEKIKPEILSTKWNQLLVKIDERVLLNPISEEEITEETERARKEFAGSRC